MCDKLIKLITNHIQQQRLLQSFTAVSLFSYSLTSVGAEPINIHDIKLPPVDTSFQLPAIGWWLLGIMGLLLIITAIYFSWQTYQKQAVRRFAKQAIKAVDCQDPDALKQINQIIKQTCLHYFPREFVAALSGEQWRLFLQGHQKISHTKPEWFNSQYQPFDHQQHPQQSIEFQQFAIAFLSQSFPPKPHRNAELTQKHGE